MELNSINVSIDISRPNNKYIIVIRKKIKIQGIYAIDGNIREV